MLDLGDALVITVAARVIVDGVVDRETVDGETVGREAVGGRPLTGRWLTMSSCSKSS
jgi:hypothetical protein